MTRADRGNDEVIFDVLEVLLLYMKTLSRDRSDYGFDANGSSY